MKTSITRAGVITAVCVVVFLYEVTIGGARPQVLSVVTMVFLAPWAAEVDAVRRAARNLTAEKPEDEKP